MRVHSKVVLPIKALGRSYMSLQSNVGPSVTSAAGHSQGSTVAAEGRCAREFRTVCLGAGALKVEVMIFGGALEKRTPLLISHSIDFPIPPSVTFCRRLWTEGFQVIFVRRLGFGQSSALPDLLLSRQRVLEGVPQVTEATILRTLIETLGLHDVLVLSFGTAAPVCARLSLMSPRIRLSIFANPAFNQAKGDGFRTKWLQSMVDQVMLSKSGAHFAARGFKFQLRRNHIKFYSQLLQRSESDLGYLDANGDDYREASRLLCEVDSNTLYYHLNSSLMPDILLKAPTFEAIDAVVLQGTETTATIERNLALECQRLGLPIERSSSGYRMLPFSCPEFLLDILARYRVSASEG